MGHQACAGDGAARDPRGPKKALKTSMAVDLASPWRPRPNFSGRSTFRVRAASAWCRASPGTHHLDIVRRVCAARGLHTDAVLENLAFHFRLPQLSNREHLRELARGLKACVAPRSASSTAVPLPAGRRPEGGAQASNLLQMGPLYSDVAELPRRRLYAILAHHFRTTRDALAQPDLFDLAFAGVQEFAAQWCSSDAVRHTGRVAVSTSSTSSSAAALGIQVPGASTLTRASLIDDFGGSEMGRQGDLRIGGHHRRGQP